MHRREPLHVQPSDVFTIWYDSCDKFTQLKLEEISTGDPFLAHDHVFASVDEV